jgi:uncharacterized membrane protein
MVRVPYRRSGRHGHAVRRALFLQGPRYPVIAGISFLIGAIVTFLLFLTRLGYYSEGLEQLAYEMLDLHLARWGRGARTHST